MFEKAFMFKREISFFCVVVRCKFEGVCIHSCICAFEGMDAHTHTMNSFN